ncbi:PucC family protein [Aureimonas altamirensis]|uniref:PucC family protein n=1 Tax=Aureimonas altamirensis TaxID=370622 RepID=UPI0025526971|nr:PucC family protein [Aureimonas altamirensis]
MRMTPGWLTIARLALIQTSIGAVVVLTTSTLNRVMVVELALPATLPSLLIAVYYAVQLTRPRFGHGSDVGMRRTPWIVGGVALLAVGGVAAAAATGLLEHHRLPGLALGIMAFAAIGAGAGAAGTALLTLTASIVSPAARGPAATAMFTMMIAGFALTTAAASRLLDPFSTLRLVAVTAMVGALAWLVALLAAWRLEDTFPEARADGAPSPFRQALAVVWGESGTRRFALFVFASMLGYSGQDVVLEPFGGLASGLTLAETTHLSAWQNGGIFCGMVLTAIAGGLLGRRYPGTLRVTAIAGAVLSALCLSLLSVGPYVGMTGETIFPLAAVLGIGLGAFTISAIGAMMAMANAGADGRAGLRMGVWGAAQALAFGLGGLVAGICVDLVALATGRMVVGYGVVFAGQALLFALAAVQARKAIRLTGATATSAFRASRSRIGQRQT